MQLQLSDAVEISGTRKTPDGYLVAETRVARSGIQIYAGHEVGRPDLATVRVYRPADEVSSDDAMKSYAYRPITVGHPKGGVKASNWRKVSVGQTGGEVGAEDVEGTRYIRVPMAIMDEAAIADIERGVRELSMGYACDLEFTDGVTDDGQEYDAIQKNMRMNHLAIVSRARGGSELKIGDETGKEIVMGNQTIMVDGLPVELTDKDAKIVQKALADAQNKAEAAQKALADAKAEHDRAMAAKDAELGEKEAEITKLKDAAVDDAQLDRLVADRQAVVAKAKAIHPQLATDGLSNADIRRKAVAHKVGDEKVADKSDDYVGALFDHLSDQAPAKRGALEDALSDRKVVTGDAVAEARKARDGRIANAWKQKAS